MAKTLPLARKEGLIVRELHEETLVYDEATHEARSLNRSAATVWKHCDGKTSIAALAQVLHQELGVPASEELVELALQQLDEFKLLQAGVPAARAPYDVSRRELLKLGFAAAFIPLVSSIVAPRPNQATSPGNDTGPDDRETGATGPIGPTG